MAGPLMTESGRTIRDGGGAGLRADVAAHFQPANLGMKGEVAVAREVNGKLQLMDPVQDRQLKDRSATTWPMADDALRGVPGYGESIDRHGRQVLVAVQPLGFRIGFWLRRWTWRRRLNRWEGWE